jgi:hypothetical protein
MQNHIQDQARALMVDHLWKTRNAANWAQAQWHARQANIWGKLCG